MSLGRYNVSIQGPDAMSLNDFLTQKTTELKPRFRPALLQREQTVFQFQFDTGEPFNLVVDGDRFVFSAGTVEHPTLTLYLDHHETCWHLLAGQIDGMTTFMEGRYRADGNIVLSQLLLYLFSGDDPTIAYQVQD